MRLKLLSLLLLAGCASEYPTGPTESGQTVLFASNRDGNFEIYAMKADGSALVRLTNQAGDDHSPTWSPDGAKILFLSSRNAPSTGAPNELYVMNADGSGVKRLTTNTLDESSPSWSPDGAKILFSTTNSRGRIYTMNADGSALTQLGGSGEWADSVPKWSPDGTRIAFLSSRALGWSLLYTMNPDGTGIVRVQTQNIGSINAYGWSPDSYAIAYEYGKWPYGGVYRVDATPRTGNFPTLLVPYPLYPTNPVWSPDGGRIALTMVIDGNMDVFTISAINGNDRVNLTNNPAADRLGSWK